MNAQTKRKLLVAYAVFVSALSIYALFFFLRHKVYLIGSDTFRYMAITDSIEQSGTVMDLTFKPAKPVKTPQNGVVIFHILLSALGFNPENRLVSIVLINYLLHLSAVYPLYKIAKKVGLKGDLPIGALLGVQLGAWHIYRLQLLPINDGIFNTLSLWLAYLIIGFFQDKYKRRPAVAALTILLAVTLVHFRLNAILILGTAFMAAIVAGQRRHVLWSVVLLLASVASLILLYAFIDGSRMSARGAQIWMELPSQLPANCLALIAQAVPALLFAPIGLRGSLIYLPFALALILALVSGLRQRKAGILFVSLSCVAAIWYMTIVPNTPVRYLAYVFPLLYLLILLPEQTRQIGYMFAALVLVSSLGTFLFKGFPREPASEFWLHLHEQQITLPDEDSLLISENPKHSYFFLEARAFQGELTRDLIDSHGGLYLAGSGEFVDAHLTEMEEAGFVFKRRSLTPGYRGEEGHALLQLYQKERHE